MSLRKTGSGKILEENIDVDLTKTTNERLAHYEELATEMTEEERQAAMREDIRRAAGNAQ